MTRLILNFEKSIEEIASDYYDKSKKYKKKLIGAREALLASKKKLSKLEKQAPEKVDIKPPRKKEWYEKFRWFHSSEGLLVIGGRDATSNEIVIKKHTDTGDLVLHTDMAGSPFFVIKYEGEIGMATIRETADATASYSRAWKLGLASSSVFYVKPDQVSKLAKAGESLPKGAFMIYGKTNYIENRMRLAIGFTDMVVGGPVESIMAQTDKFVKIKQGNKKSSDIAKLIKKKIGGEIDEIIRFLPAGGVELS